LFAVNRNIQLLAKGDQLVDSSRPLQVVGNKQSASCLLSIMYLANFAAVVVLPQPCNPARSISVGPGET